MMTFVSLLVVLFSSSVLGVLPSNDVKLILHLHQIRLVNFYWLVVIVD